MEFMPRQAGGRSEVATAPINQVEAGVETVLQYHVGSPEILRLP
jgi:hypothetical protein